jgi:hypothetical protein
MDKHKMSGIGWIYLVYIHISDLRLKKFNSIRAFAYLRGK